MSTSLRPVLRAGELSRLADELRDATHDTLDPIDVIEIAVQLTDVAGHLATVYDQLARSLLEQPCPARHAAHSLVRAGDELRAAGSACRYARNALQDANA